MTAGDIMRSILAEAHAVMPWDQQGPFYVIHNQGTFTLWPFGTGARHRYNYRMSQYQEYEQEPYWVFNVTGRGGR